MSKREKVLRFLARTGAKCKDHYYAIFELLCLFGYISVEEIEYHLGIKKQEIYNRLWYLVKNGVVQKFASYTVPTNFYCFTPLGRQLAREFGVTYYYSDFVPHKYNLMYQRHHRGLIKVYSALSQVFGSKLRSFISDEYLRSERYTKRARIYDAEFYLTIYIRVYVKDDVNWKGEYMKKVEEKKVRCYLELELNLKSPKAYEKQIKDMVDYQDRETFMYLFVYGSETIKDRLKKHLNRYPYTFSNRVVAFVGYEDLINKKGEAVVELLTGQKRLVSELNEWKRYE